MPAPQCYLRGDTGHRCCHPQCSLRLHLCPVTALSPGALDLHTPNGEYKKMNPCLGENEKPVFFPRFVGASLEVRKYANVVSIPKVRIPKPQNSCGSMSPASLFHGSYSLLPVHQALDHPRNVYIFQDILLVLPPLHPLHQGNGTLCTPLKSCYQQDIRRGST